MTGLDAMNVCRVVLAIYHFDTEFAPALAELTSVELLKEIEKRYGIMLLDNTINDADTLKLISKIKGYHDIAVTP